MCNYVDDTILNYTLFTLLLYNFIKSKICLPDFVRFMLGSNKGDRVRTTNVKAIFPLIFYERNFVFDSLNCKNAFGGEGEGEL